MDVKEPYLYKVEIAGVDQPFVLESGQAFSSAPVVYESYGTLNERKDNAILVFHGLSSSSHGASHNPEDLPGWWEPLIGPGKVLDSSRYFVVIPNILGSCGGSLGPLTIQAETGRPYGKDFPEITVRDMVCFARKFLDQLGISSPKMVIGGSLGGMQALEWAASYPEDSSDIVAIVAPERSSSQSIGFNYLMRKAIWEDPLWQDGNYSKEDFPMQGLSLARGIGMMTYQTFGSMEEKFSRRKQDGRWEIESYLDYQGEKLAKRFDANSYLRLINSMDHHDLAEGRLDYPERMKRKTKGRVLLIGDDSDMLYSIQQQKKLADKWRCQGVEVEWKDLGTDHGHDSFLKDFDLLEHLMKEFMGA